MDLLITIGQLILGLSILVALHEFGHFLPAKLFGMRVEKFFLFFDWPRHLWQKKVGDTTYGLGMLPFGGYVKIAGMIDESMDREQKERMERPPEPWEFRAKPVWQRLIVMVGGVTVNVLLGFAIYSMVLYTWGSERMPLTNLTWGVTPNLIMEEQGFQSGDRIVAVPGEHVETLEDVSLAILIRGARTVTVERNGARKDITLTDDIAEKILDTKDKQLFAERFPFVVDSVMAGSGAQDAGGFRPGDRVMAVNGQPAAFFSDFRIALKGKEGRQVDVTVRREGHLVVVPVQVSEDGAVGLYSKSALDFLRTEIKEYSLLGSIPAGISYGWKRMQDNVESFKLLGSKSGLKQMGGLGSMAKAYGPRWIWSRFWEMTAFLSMALAFLNILPIPALDGGHVIFLLYEAIARRPAPPKVLEYAQMAGMVFLLTVIIAVNGHDLFKLFTGQL
ncbi:MAG TPA: RIP metalloprotease RseP [Flavobacteriales bacterium]|jgi:regulator of sigma E protease|nr:RIP metalloprotease RseP [Flavobacteriales bacterium]HNI03397.1 RIP metalloprotease RseP [Flavobacteriales bacterium]HNK42310.1 RIP metalloprotease RseP [Flavobacteriales bacterium]HNK68753.1 RIP metalloprotease RseP [Flavobacteriales bacterium]HNK84864.1 RIP metalloprotease RseP [Flavobacteriales bacterium]